MRKDKQTNLDCYINHKKTAYLLFWPICYSARSLKQGYETYKTTRKIRHKRFTHKVMEAQDRSSIFRVKPAV